MRVRTLLAISLATILVLGSASLIVLNNGGSPLPPKCPRSIHLAKFSSDVTVLPADGSGFDLGIGILPFLNWDASDASCEVPASASVDVTLTCTDVDTSTPFVIGPQSFPQATPTTPGPQPDGGTIVEFTMPADTPQATCTVEADYNVGFLGEVIGNTLTATGDLQICLVEPAPADPSGDTPRLDLELLTPEPLPGRDGEDGTYTFHAGDQEYIYIRIDNNDLENKLEIDFESIGRQTALFPEGFDDDEDAYDAGVFRIADPADTWPIEFYTHDEPLPIVRLPDLADTDDGTRTTRIELDPGESDIFGLYVRSFGTSGIGAGNEREICGVGIFKDDNDNEVGRSPACVQPYFDIDFAEPRFPGLTFDLQIAVGATVDTQWGPAQFLDPTQNLIDQTQKGNLIPGLILPELQGGPAIQLTGLDLQSGPAPFPDQWIDQFVLPVPPHELVIPAFFFYEQDGFQRRGSELHVLGLEQLQAPCELPLITINQPLNPLQNNAEVEADVSNGCDDNTPIVLREGGQVVQQGTIGQLKQDQNLRVDTETLFTLNPAINTLPLPFMVPDPPMIVQNFEPNATDPIERAIQILDQLDQELEFQVQFEGTNGVALVGTQGTGTSNIFLDPALLLDPFDEILGFLIFENDLAVNSPLAVPVLGRRLPVPPLPPLPIDLELDLPPLVQVGQSIDVGLLIPPLDPQPVDPYFNMEFFIGIETNDPIEIEIPDPFEIIPIDPDTPQAELDRLGGKFGEEPIGRCSEGVWKCGKIEFGDGFTFETQIFADGFESGDVSSWSTGAAADNSASNDNNQRVGVLDENERLPIFTEEELRAAIELFNDDVVFDEKTIGLVTDRFGIEVPLPPIRGTYFFDEFESFRKQASDHVTVDFENCTADEANDMYCSFVFEGGNGGINGLRIQNAKSAIVIASDSNSVTNSTFVDNVTGVFVESGVSNRIRGNTFAGNRLGIDLGGDSTTENDAGDSDEGANNLQNYPVLTEALISNSTTIRGSFDGEPNMEIEVDVFASETGNCATVGQNGERFLGSGRFITNASGRAPFELVVDSTAARMEYITATATDSLGNTSEISPCVQVVTGVASEGVPELPRVFALDQNYPNPFNPSTEIGFSLPEASVVQLVIFDATGREIARLVDGLRPAGVHHVRWNASDLSSGVYVYRLEAESFKESRRMVLLK